MSERGNGPLTLPDAEQERLIAQANARGFANAKVMCDAHRPMKVWKGWVECDKPECQGVMAARREGLRTAGAPTEEQKARWLAGLTGRAAQKPSLREER